MSLARRIDAGDAFRSRAAVILVGIGLGALVVARCPQLLAQPRFWAEEGRVYFAHAWNQGFWSALVSPQLGYFALVPNAAAAGASLAPLPSAPLVTTLAAFAVQLLVSALALTSRSRLLDSAPRRLAVALGIQLMAPAEAWLTTIAAQFWLCIAAFLVLVEDDPPMAGPALWFRRAVLGAAALTGIPSSFLVPVYLLRARRLRARETWIQLGILSGGALAQLAAVVVALASNDASVANRFASSDFSLWLLLLHFVDPLVGLDIFDSAPAAWMDRWFLELVGERSASFSFTCVALLLVALLAILLASALRDLGARTAGLSFVLVALLSNLSAIQTVSAPRYAFAPSVMLLVLFIAQLRSGIPRWRQAVGGLLLTTALVSNLTSYRQRVFIHPSWPRWPDEVGAWREGRSEELRIWPRFASASWSVKLRQRP